MDKLDWKIVTELEGNGRQSFAELGETVGLSKSPCWSRVRALEQKGVISGYAARIDPLALGLEVQSFVEVQIRFDAHAEFEAAVLSHPAVVECHTTAVDSDYVLKVFEIGRASCRERRCKYVEISVGAVSLKKKNIRHENNF